MVKVPQYVREHLKKIDRARWVVEDPCALEWSYGLCLAERHCQHLPESLAVFRRFVSDGFPRDYARLREYNEVARSLFDSRATAESMMNQAMSGEMCRASRTAIMRIRGRVTRSSEMLKQILDMQQVLREMGEFEAALALA